MAYLKFWSQTMVVSFLFKEFKDLTVTWGITHVTSSPKFTQSNGDAERAVQTVKQMLDQPDVSLALLSNRSTPIPSLGVSPAELALGRKVCTCLPSLQQNLFPKSSHSFVQETNKRVMELQKLYHDLQHGVQPLSALQPGQAVRVKCDDKKGWEESGRVVEQSASRSYILDTPSGQHWRNRCHLKVVSEGVDGGGSNIITELPEDGASVLLRVPEAQVPALSAKWPDPDPRANPALTPHKWQTSETSKAFSVMCTSGAL